MNYAKETIENINQIVSENQRLIEHISLDDIDNAIAYIKKAKRIFFMGTGRSGLALKMAAMRFMHLGFQVYVVGEIVTPAILDGDLLIVASGSGTTSTVLTAAEKAKKVNATILAISTEKDNPLAAIATIVLQIPAAQKTDFSKDISIQYAGSLFEQFTLFVLDGIFTTLWQHSGKTKEDLWPQHANLE